MPDPTATRYIELDHADHRILTALQADGRITNQALAERVGISTAACWRRLQALVASGIVRRFTALLDGRRLGYELTVFVHVTLTRHAKDATAAFERAVKARAEVLDCYAVTGDADFTLRVVATDIAGYDRFLEDFVFTLPGIAQVRSSIVLREVKADVSIPLPAPAGNKPTRVAPAVGRRRIGVRARRRS